MKFHVLFRDTVLKNRDVIAAPLINFGDRAFQARASSQFGLLSGFDKLGDSNNMLVLGCDVVVKHFGRRFMISVKQNGRVAEDRRGPTHYALFDL